MPGCRKKGEELSPTLGTDPAIETDNFIKANVEIICAVKENPEIKTNQEELKDLVNSIYLKYGFPVTEDAEMIKIIDKYKGTPDIKTQIEKNSKDCSS